MNKKNMYIVIKREDAFKYLTESDLKLLDNMLGIICKGRSNDNKNPVNNYYVCNTDEPYANVVHGVIIGGEAAKDNYVNSSYCPDACGSSCNECFE